MRFAHISDLHLGKRFNAKPLIEEQRDILQKIRKIANEQKVDALLVAGDIYDKSIPSEEAVLLFDEFLTDISSDGIQVLAIAGNHDSAERLSYASHLMKKAGVFVSPVYRGKAEKVTLQDKFGPVNIYLQQFVKPADVRQYHPDETIDSYTDALQVCIQAMDVNPAERNILVAHQYVTSGEGEDMWMADSCESEEPSVGGLGNVDIRVFAPFDYVALGHLHRPQNCAGKESVRYCGSPLKYSFSEAGDRKTVTIIDMGTKGEISYDRIELKPLRDLVDIRGSFAEVTDIGFYQGTSFQDDYVRIRLTDPQDIPNVKTKLESIYHNLVDWGYDRQAQSAAGDLPGGDAMKMDPMELFESFFNAQNPTGMSDEQREYIKTQIENIWKQ